MTATDLVGSVVIIEHPAFYSTHVVAKVESVTAKTMMVRYWRINRGWSEEPSRRKVVTTTAVLGRATDLSDAALDLAFNRLNSWRSEAVERSTAAWQTYAKKVRSLGPKDLSAQEGESK